MSIFYTIEMLNTQKHWFFFLSTLDQFIIAIQQTKLDGN